MIIEFSVENFLSFKEKTTFSMVASSDKSLMDNVTNVNNEKILKTAVIYGANASGKSNLFKILVLVTSMIRNSAYHAPNFKLPIIPFKLNNLTIKMPSMFEIIFIADEIKYKYGFKADADKVHEEYLYYYPNGKSSKIFLRSSVDDYDFNVKDEKELNAIKEKNTSNKFFISTATNWNFKKTKPAFDFLTEEIGVVLNAEQLNGYSYNMYSKDKEKGLEKFALNFLEKADFNIKGYKVEEIKAKDEKDSYISNDMNVDFSKEYNTYNINTTHIINDEKFELNLFEESYGTQMIFSYIPVIKDVLDNQKVFIVDEFDRSLHPHIVKYIVEIFNNPEINKKGSQLIFNTHDTNLLDLYILRRDQIWFTEKDISTASSMLYPLDGLSVRKTENIRNGYLLGRYGGIPFINQLDNW